MKTKIKENFTKKRTIKNKKVRYILTVLFLLFVDSYIISDIYHQANSQWSITITAVAEADNNGSASAYSDGELPPENRNTAKLSGVVRHRRNIMEVEASAYTSTEGQTDNSPCISASGDNICEIDGCIVAYNGLPLGSKIEVEGFGECTVLDRMNSRYGANNIDIYFKHDLQGALNFGRKLIKIRTIKQIK